MANIWNLIAIIVAIIGFLFLLAAWFVQPTANTTTILLNQNKRSLFLSAIALFVLAIVIWIGAAANLASNVLNHNVGIIPGIIRG